MIFTDKHNGGTVTADRLVRQRLGDQIAEEERHRARSLQDDDPIVPDENAEEWYEKD